MPKAGKSRKREETPETLKGWKAIGESNRSAHLTGKAVGFRSCQWPHCRIHPIR